MQWWNDLVDWFASEEGRRLTVGTILPFAAILVAGVVAALIGRSSVKRVIAVQNREAKASAVAALIAAARKAAVWTSLSSQEQQRVDYLASEADVRVRLLPVSGASLAADWAAHQIGDMKRNSASFSFQAEQTLAELRDRLIEWQAHPSRVRKSFKLDLERWRFEKPDGAEAEAIENQRLWAAQQVVNAPEPRDLTPAVPPTTVVPPAPSTPVPPPAAPIAAPAPSAQEATAGGSERFVPSPDAQTPGGGFAPAPTESYSPITASTVRQRTTPPEED